MDPWISGRMPLAEVTIAEALQKNGYVSGHSGKWHMAIDHNAFPQPQDQGFDFTGDKVPGTDAAFTAAQLKNFMEVDVDSSGYLDKEEFDKVRLYGSFSCDVTQE